MRRKHNPLKDENNQYYRNCPECCGRVFHKNRATCVKGMLANGLCMKCYGKRQTGEGNPFYGKKHTKESLAKIAKGHVGIKYTGEKLRKAREVIKIMHASTNRKPFYQVWVEKYGIEVAESKMKQYKAKQSENFSGSNNPMFGRPAPRGSGNGWKSRYKGIYFRSLREVIFFITEIEQKNLQWCECHASNGFRIPYKDALGNDRNYFPDYCIDGKRLVECKPAKLQNTPTVKLKTEAAKKFCEERGMVFEFYDVKLDDHADLSVEKYKLKELVFDERYEDKFKKRHGIE